MVVYIGRQGVPGGAESAFRERGSPFSHIAAGHETSFVQLREHKAGIFFHALIMLLKRSIVVIEQIDKVGQEHIYAAYMAGGTPSVEIRGSVPDFAVLAAVLSVFYIPEPFFIEEQHIVIIHGLFKAHRHIVQPGQAFVPLGAVCRD